MTTTGKSRMSPRLSTSAPGWLLGWTFRRRNWFGIKVMNSALAALSLRDTGGIQKVRCQRLIMFAGLKPRRESLEFQKGWAAMAVLNLEWEWNIRCGGHIPGYPRTLHPLLPARAPISAEAAVDSSAHARTRLSLTSRTLHVSFPFPNATAVCLTLYTGATWKCKETKPLWTRSPQGRQERVGQCSTPILGKVTGGEGSAHFAGAPATGTPSDFVSPSFCLPPPSCRLGWHPPNAECRLHSSPCLSRCRRMPWPSRPFHTCRADASLGWASVPSSSGASSSRGKVTAGKTLSLS